MHLRHVLLIMSGIGAAGSFLLALDFYRRMKDAERIVFINNIAPGPDSMLHIGMGHVLGLIALGLIFLALLMALLPALKDPVFVAAIENKSAPPPPSIFAPQAVQETLPPATPPHETPPPPASAADAEMGPGTTSASSAPTPEPQSR